MATLINYAYCGLAKQDELIEPARKSLRNRFVFLFSQTSASWLYGVSFCSLRQIPIYLFLVTPNDTYARAGGGSAAIDEGKGQAKQIKV